MTTNLKITKVEALYLRLPEVKDQCDSGQDALIVSIETDAGITGIGEVDSSPMAVKGAIEGPYSHTITSGLGHLLLNEDPFETERLWFKMYNANVYSGRFGVAFQAMSGIDMALWDIKGKALGMPVWKLLGGGFHQKIRCYASSLFGATPKATGEMARRFRGQGFNAVKFGWAPMGRDEQTDIALVREARKGLGDSADLLIDAGLVWDAKTALQRAIAFSEQRIFWLEEPLRPDDYEGYRKLASATPVRIAAGEEESGRRGFLELMDRGQIDVAQVDLTRCGGFTEAMKIASLAWDRGVPVANHGFTTYINVTAALHWLNAIPNALICEFVAEEETNLREQITKQKLRAKDGYLDIPQEPGLGIDLDEEAIRRYRVA
ncbi:MAG: mandelate racemase/muconate lactonizing enzyme family protein [Bryobacterales bacterium]|nr:mandelate racemase/muconate lactonizing enzyme family protein [Bryobacterales bacterium]